MKDWKKCTVLEKKLTLGKMCTLCALHVAGTPLLSKHEQHFYVYTGCFKKMFDGDLKSYVHGQQHWL